MQYRLGKRPARKGAIRFQFAQYFDRSNLPTPPMRFGHEKIGQPWQMFSNDKYANCVFAGAAHEHMVWTHEGGRTSTFSEAGVLADYAAVTGFDPANPDTDQGTDMAEAAGYRRRTGVIDAAGVRHKIDSYVGLRAGHVDDLLLAAYMTGGCGIGLQLPGTAMDDFDAGRPWDVRSGAHSEGGHYVPCIGRNSAGMLLVITWGRIQAVTPAFYDRYCDEAVAYLSLEALRGKTTPDGFDEATLRTNLGRLSSKPAHPGG